MGKSRAEIQREYRARKKAKEGDSYKQKERERVKKYYVPIDERPKKEQKARREYVKKCVKRHRQLQEIAKRNIESQNENEIVASTSSAAASSSSTMDSEVTSSTDVCSSNVSSPCLVVKLPNLDPKKRTRKRISRATARNRREIERLKLENENMQRRYKTVSKRYERLRAKVTTSFFVRDGNAEDSSMPQRNIPTITTSRKRTSTELRKGGVTPTKLPKVILKKLVMAEMNKTLAPVKGSLQIHSVTPVGLGKISNKSCYCEKCLDGNYHDGIVTDMVQKQKIDQSMPTAEVLQEEKTRSCDVENDEVANNIEVNESLKEFDNELISESNLENEAHILKEKDWVAVKLEGDWFIGKIIEVDTESKDYKITFVRKSNSTNIKQTNFKWPMPADELWVKFENILLKIKEPTPFGRSSRSFDISKLDLEKIQLNKLV